MSVPTPQGTALGTVATSTPGGSSRGYSSLLRRESVRFLLPVAALTLLALLLRRYHLGDESLWFDEADIVSRARQPLPGLVQGFALPGENGPLYTLLLHFWLALLDTVPGLGSLVHLIFGASYEAPIRVLSALFGTAAIPPMYLFAKWVGGHRLGLLGAALLAVNPFHIWYSQDAKMYSLLVLMSLVGTLLYLRAIERNSPLLWAGYVLATWITLTTHSFGVLVLLAHLVATPLLFKARPQGGEVTQGSRRLLRWGWAMLLIIGPLFPIVWLRAAALLTDTLDAGGWYAPAGLHEIAATLLTSFSVNRAPQPWEMMGTVIMTLLAVAGAWWLVSLASGASAQTGMTVALRARRQAVPVLLLSLLLLPVAALWLVTLRIPLFQARYLIMALPFYLVMVAGGIYWLGRRRVILSSLPVAALAISTIVALSGVNYSNEPQKEDWRGALAYVQDHARLRDLIVVFPGYLESAVDVYYRPGGPGRVPDIPTATIPGLRTQGFGENELNRALGEATSCRERAWLVTSPVRQALEDPRNLVQQWFQFNYHTFDTRDYNGVTLYGISFNGQPNCWYPNPDFEEVHTFENGLEFWGYIYELRAGATTQPDASYFPLTLYWRTRKQLTEDYTIAISIKSASGEVIKEDALGPLNGYWPTSQWPGNGDVIDYRDIRLPGGMVPGKYTISLRVYPKDRPETPLKLTGGGTEIVLKEPLQVVPWQP